MDMTGLMALALREGASDLHLAAGTAPMIRRGAAIEPLGLAVLDVGAMQALLGQLMSPQQLKDYETLQDLDFCVALPGQGRVRVNAFVQLQGAAAVLRLIPDTVPSLATLQLPDVFRQIAEQPAGLVLVTGATGSGKSTTLAALVDHLNCQRGLHILTLEDPIEFIHSPVRSRLSQREIGRHSKGFAQALRAALRQDPDVIMLGELRDLESIRLALSAAETGHLVLATLHTRSASSSIDRLVEVFAADEKAMVRSMLAESLQAVVAQVLVGQVDGGRVAAHEILLATPAVRNLIREGKVAQLYSAMQTGAAAGMQTLDACLQGLVRRGVINREAARANARSPELF
ncbi:type IV pilus twitching motility protein PilT [Pseudomonas aegrilactucae]|uniref:Type IV pilus twitching motility protein PilT n=1 Tax=Pseudomonas aegrilactucae TaxID=2854028 RepID=A0A9Q3AG77_9PSED|nr:type IV pilus twitching motility protein PilT [Pseudomonas aegrilactucae]MBV6289145.1 type IV pilus twitching motility protein PilT [Pseudomonas aegrilactucae]